MNAQPLPIEDDAQEQHPIADSVTCGATLPSPSGTLVCDRELLHPGGHSQGGRIAWARR